MTGVVRLVERLDDEGGVVDVAGQEDGGAARVSDGLSGGSEVRRGLFVADLAGGAHRHGLVPGGLDGVGEAGAVVVGHVEDGEVGRTGFGHHVRGRWALNRVARHDAVEQRVVRVAGERRVGGGVGDHGDPGRGEDGVGAHRGTGAGRTDHGDDAGVNEGLCAGAADGTVAARVDLNGLELHVIVHGVQVVNGLGDTPTEAGSVGLKGAGLGVQEADLHRLGGVFGFFLSDAASKGSGEEGGGQQQGKGAVGLH